jgi:hypothetical protein
MEKQDKPEYHSPDIFDLLGALAVLGCIWYFDIYGKIYSWLNIPIH